MSKELLKIRSRIDVLQPERDALLNAGPTRAEACERIDFAVNEAAESDDAKRVREHLAAGMIHEAFYLAHRAPPQVPHNLFGMLAAVLGVDRLSAALQEHVAHLPDGPNATQRADRLAQIQAELDKLETEEERIIELSELSGVAPIARRADARPEIILAVR